MINGHQNGLRHGRFTVCQILRFYVEMSPHCTFSTTFIMGSVLRKFLTCFPSLNFLTAQYTSQSEVYPSESEILHPHHLDM